MTEELGRRRFLICCSLPVVAVLLLLLAARLTAMQRARVVALLVERVASGTASEATAAARQLAAMPNPPWDAVFKAAAKTNGHVATEAQRAVDEMLGRCEQRIDTGRNLGVVAAQLTDLTLAIAEWQGEFSASHQPWIGETMQRVLRLANRLPTTIAPALAARCDAVLASVSSTDAGRSSSFARPPAPFDRPQSTNQLATAPIHDASSRAGPNDAGIEPLDSVLTVVPPSSIDNKRSDGQRSMQALTVPHSLAPPVEHAPPKRGQSPAAAWRAKWSNPVTALAAPRPIEKVDLQPLADAAITTDATPRLVNEDSRALLRQWRDADRSHALGIEQELFRRGFGRLSHRLVDRLFDEKPSERLRLVDDVLSEPSVGVRAWLLLLVEDPNADVRLLTVTVMATSTDAVLLEAAWQAAIRDPDPRVADLAPRLYERRGGIQR